MSNPLLSVDGLVVHFDTPEGTVHAVDGVSFEVDPAETVAVVGESGSGKSVTMLAALGLIPQPPGRVVAGQVHFDGRDLLTLRHRQLRRLRGREIGVVFQDPLTSLHPCFRVGDQVAEAVRAHDRRVSRSAARARAVELLGSVGVPDATGRAGQHPHQWSGGMRQRAMIAIAMANDPRLLIADEPTTALDVTTQAEILDLLRRTRDRTSVALVLVTHDFGVVAEIADRVVVLYAGRVVETGAVVEVFDRPSHPYTRALLESLPQRATPGDELTTVPGQPPRGLDPPAGCRFAPRCPLRRGRARCLTDDPSLRLVARRGQAAACHFAEELLPGGVER